jgi:predicted O-linked N-acetylglucosamine transferase (SPINDLY family)
MPGENIASRQTLGFLSAIGELELVATSPQDYLARSVALASNPAHLRELRGSLRPALAASPLCDGPKFTRTLEAAYRQMWRRHVAGEKPEVFSVADEESAA